MSLYVACSPRVHSKDNGTWHVKPDDAPRNTFRERPIGHTVLWRESIPSRPTFATMREELVTGSGIACAVVMFALLLLIILGLAGVIH
jgi:hypothetical protein